MLTKSILIVDLVFRTTWLSLQLGCSSVRIISFRQVSPSCYLISVASCSKQSLEFWSASVLVAETMFWPLSCISVTAILKMAMSSSVISFRGTDGSRGQVHLHKSSCETRSQTGSFVLERLQNKPNLPHLTGINWCIPCHHLSENNLLHKY